MPICEVVSCISHVELLPNIQNFFTVLLYFTGKVPAKHLQFYLCFTNLLSIESLSLNDLQWKIAPDRRHHDNCTVLLTKACSRLQCADKKLIILLLFWHPCSHFCTAMKEDGRPLPSEFTENEIPVTNHWRLCIMTFLFSMCFPPKLFHLCPNKKNTYEKHSATVGRSHRHKFNLMWPL